MAHYQVTGEKSKEVARLFEGWEETLIWSALEGCMGEVFVENLDQPKSAQIITADFCFFAGQPHRELVEHMPSSFIIMVPQNEAWGQLIEEVYGERAKKIVRYAIKKEKDVFDRFKLQQIVEHLEAEYEVKLIDESLYKQCLAQDWSSDLCSQFPDYETYKKMGLGVVILYKGEVVAGASSYTCYSQGIEIEIDTKEEFRRRGLASVCGAKLILECLSRGLYPSWDAQNKWSVALAEKLGYHFDREYTAYEVK